MRYPIRPDDIDRLPDQPALPDPLEGIASAADWPARREHLLAELLRWQYGPFPPTGDPVVFTEEGEDDDGTRRRTLRCGPGGALSCRVLWSVPDGPGPFPTIVDGDLSMRPIGPQIRSAVLEAGFALAEFARTDLASDSAQRDGVYAVWPDHPGGRLAAWAWGYHRVIDALCAQPETDPRGIVVTGHSRGGKTALLAGALDPRVAVTAPNNSGCGGAGCYRLQGPESEDLMRIADPERFAFWFAPGFRAFAHRESRLPFDQHTLKACVAPRALITTEALGDLWANPSGSQATHDAAVPVFTLLGVPDRIAIHFREGGHEHNLDDWRVLLRFAQKALRG